eukprot:scaffold2520_cov134-Skeletonema_dohrnii-CCMP3373.AAC.1
MLKTLHQRHTNVAPETHGYNDEKNMTWILDSYCVHEDQNPDKAKNLIGIPDIKMDFDRKARFVAGGHMTDTPPRMAYSSVSRDNVRLVFLIAASNRLCRDRV